MTIISIRLPEKLLHEVDQLAKANHIPRAEYIRNAIEFMNKEMGNKKRIERLKNASLRVK